MLRSFWFFLSKKFLSFLEILWGRWWEVNFGEWVGGGMGVDMEVNRVDELNTPCRLDFRIHRDKWNSDFVLGLFWIWLYDVFVVITSAQ